MDVINIYPNLTWAQFEVFNDNTTDDFEDMCRDLFACEYLHEKENPHSDHNNPGVEVVPVLEPPRMDGKPQRQISFQAKYFSSTINYSDIKDSLKKAVQYYRGRLDVIYLFCNRVISYSTKKYRELADILEPSGIELCLVTDKDIFALLRKYKRVAEYYFQDRKRSVPAAYDLIEQPIISTGITDTAVDPGGQSLLHAFIKDRLDKCQKAILDLNFGELKADLELFSSVSDENADWRVAFYQIILEVHEKADFSEIINHLPDDKKEEAYWLKNLVKCTRDVAIDEFTGLSLEAQTVVLDVLFSSQHWKNIVDFYSFRNQFDAKILKAYDFHYALSQFNLGDFQEAHSTLSGLFDEYKETRFKLYDICTQLNEANRNFKFGRKECIESVKSLLLQLDEIKQPAEAQVKANGELVAVIELQSLHNLGVSDRHYLDEAIERYNKLAEDIQSADGVMLFMGLIYSLKGDSKTAKAFFSRTSWTENETFASRYFTSLIDLGESENVIEAYGSLKDPARTVQVESIYLLALYRLKDKDYQDKINEQVESHSSSLSDLLQLGLYTEDRAVFKKIVLPRIDAILPYSLESTDIQTKIGLLAVLSHYEQIHDVKIILDSIHDLTVINNYVANDIYRCLFNLLNQKPEAWKAKGSSSGELDTVEAIATRFYDADLLRKQFLQIKLLYATVNHMSFSMLKYSKDLFEYTGDVNTARNIIALLYERSETHLDAYEPYLTSLKESDDPTCSMAAASALVRLGKYEEADFYAYKAVYYLNGKDDFNIYKSLFGYHYSVMQIRKTAPERKTVGHNMIVILTQGDETRKIALDSEAEFDDESNRSLGVEHINHRNPLYSKLIGASKNQIINIDSLAYRVAEFDTRDFYVGRFIFEKIQQYPEQFKGTVWTISTKDSKELVQQLKELTDRRDQTNIIVDLYNFKDNQWGIPVDFFIEGDYEKYISTLQYLMYKKDLAYYAGEPSFYEYDRESKIVPTLSTLLIMALHGWLDTLDWIEDQIVIPESYLDFFRRQYEAVTVTQSLSEGSLVAADDGKLSLVSNDKRLPDIWEAILEKCKNYMTEPVTDDERIGFEIVPSATWERAFSNGRLDLIQLDSFIVAERENGIYLCDDLFFRKIAKVIKLRSINFASLLYLNRNPDDTVPIIMELSKSNYIYTPFRYRTHEEGNTIIKNLLDGERKNIFYTQFLSKYIEVQDQVMRQYFGDNWKDRFLSDKEDDMQETEE